MSFQGIKNEPTHTSQTSTPLSYGADDIFGELLNAYIQYLIYFEINNTAVQYITYK